MHKYALMLFLFAIFVFFSPAQYASGYDPAPCSNQFMITNEAGVFLDVTLQWVAPDGTSNFHQSTMEPRSAWQDASRMQTGSTVKLLKVACTLSCGACPSKPVEAQLANNYIESCKYKVIWDTTILTGCGLKLVPQ